MMKPNEIVQYLETIALSSKPNYAQFWVEVGNIQQHYHLSGKELAQSNIAIRLSLALQDFAEGRAGIADVAVLLRQIIRAYGRRFIVSKKIWDHLVQRSNDVGLRQTDERPDGAVELVADDWEPVWLPKASTIDVLEERRSPNPVIGDGSLYKMTEWHTYQSESQKAAVQGFLFAPPGSTLLVNLPTGGGKSLSLLLPAWVESYGGQVPEGTTLVIVPTVSLALDQEVQSRKYFSRTINQEYTPQCQTSDTSEEKRAAIRRGIRNESLPILYLSPEALLNSALYNICLDAAREGKLKRLVIDEAHLIETWGATFRTEFQVLATYRKKLLEASGGQLRTLLLSATTTSSCATLLEKLFSEEGHFSHIQSNQLRSEISYWFSFTPDSEERERRVCEALRHLPRPLILYTARPEDASEWHKILRKEGYKRIASFTGRTNANKRRQLMHEWNQNKFDIMIATSAFGLGVDKQDIRTIIHACLPENIDRYYQEVGRSGRDGCSAISLLCTTHEDNDTTFGIQSKSRITTEKALERWQGMRQSATFHTDKGNMLLIDMNAPPRNKPDMKQGERNQEWNRHTILLMQRAGLILLTDPRSEIPIVHHSDDDDTAEQKSSVRLEIELLHPRLEEDSVFETAIGDVIEREKNDIREAIRKLHILVRAYAKGKTKQCLAHAFAETYLGTALTCGGCPYCRQHAIPPYTTPEKLTADGEPIKPTIPFVLNEDIQRKIGKHNTLHILWEGISEPRTFHQLDPLFIELVEHGFQQYILPSPLLNDSEWMKSMIQKMAQKHAHTPHMLLPLSWVLDTHKPPVYPVLTVVIYPSESKEADALYRALQEQLDSSVPRIHIITRNLYLPSEYGLFKDRVNGLSQTLESFLTFLRSIQEEYF